MRLLGWEIHRGHNEDLPVMSYRLPCATLRVDGTRVRTTDLNAVDPHTSCAS